jgi:hypothetical protein
MKGVSWVNLLIGIWLLFAPRILHTSGVAMTNSIVMGIIVMAIAALSLASAAAYHVPAWINVAAGFWVFFSAWGLHVNHQTPLVVTNAIAGALIIIFALARGSAGRAMPA